ncbi:MAG: amidase [Thermoleophilaceae bacterium]|nr:amidase [Thermoleophilaceae bacterium]
MDARELAFAGAARQLELLRAGEVSCRELVEAHLSRIERLDPRLNAFRVVFAERALAEAEQAQARLRAGDERPLLGIPVALKDNVDVAGEITAHGSGAARVPAGADSEAVRRLRAAGAILIGKTHMPELAIWPICESINWGASRNPWAPDRTTGGSSGGSGAAVAAGLAPLALGTDGGGSIRIPSACCGVFGLKPQRGRVSLGDPVEHWHGLSVIGPIARSVIDAALFLDAVAGAAPGDPEGPPPPERPFAEAARSRPPRLRIAISAKPVLRAKVDEQWVGALHSTAALLRSLGHEVVERDPDYPELRPHFAPRWLRGIYEDARAMDMPDRLERRTRQAALMGRLTPPAAVRWARGKEREVAARINRVLDDCDVLVTPTLAYSAPPIGRWEGRGALTTLDGVARWIPFTTPWNVTGQPAASVPAGFDRDGLPLAVQLVGRPRDEATLLSLAAQIEAERPWADALPPLS